MYVSKVPWIFLTELHYCARSPLIFTLEVMLINTSNIYRATATSGAAVSERNGHALQMQLPCCSASFTLVGSMAMPPIHVEPPPPAPLEPMVRLIQIGELVYSQDWVYFRAWVLARKHVR